MGMRMRMSMRMTMRMAVFMHMLVVVSVVMPVVVAVTIFMDMSVVMFVLMAVAMAFLMVMLVAMAFLVVVLVTVAMPLLHMDMNMRMLVSTGLIMAVPAAIKIFHIMVVVFVSFIQDNIKIAGIQPRLLHPADLHLKAAHRQTV